MFRHLLSCSFVALAAFAFIACDKSAPEKPKPPASASASPASTASAPATTLEDDLCKGQPYRKRCEKACKESAARILSGPCAAELNAFMSITSADFGKCLAGCTAKGDITCVGAEDPGHCDCKVKCYRALPPDVLEKARAAARCQHREIIPACE